MMKLHRLTTTIRLSPLETCFVSQEFPRSHNRKNQSGACLLAQLSGTIAALFHVGETMWVDYWMGGQSGMPTS
jgi:hypothetical protein